MIINLTQHPATSEQIEAGVVDIPGEFRERLAELLTFDAAPSALELKQRADQVFALYREACASLGAEKDRWGSFVSPAMIGGAPFFQAPLEIALRGRATYAFSRRESVETTQPDGSVRKVAVFRHGGFVGGVVYDALVAEWYAGNNG